MPSAIITLVPARQFWTGVKEPHVTLAHYPNVDGVSGEDAVRMSNLVDLAMMVKKQLRGSLTARVSGEAVFHIDPVHNDGFNRAYVDLIDAYPLVGVRCMLEDLSGPYMSKLHGFTAHVTRGYGPDSSSPIAFGEVERGEAVFDAVGVWSGEQHVAFKL